jgi:DNA-directed RNA polymerase specialized sigma subunit
MAKVTVDPNYVPVDQGDLYAKYDWVVRMLLRRKGIVEIEDASQTVWSYMLGVDYIARFDPAAGTPFKKFIIGIIYLRVQDYIRNMMKLRERERPMPVDEDGEQLDYADPNQEDATDVASESLLNAQLQAIEEALSSLPSTKTTNFARLFHHVIEQVSKEGQLNHTEIGRAYGLELAGREFSRQAIKQQLDKLVTLEQVQALRAILAA